MPANRTRFWGRAGARGPCDFNYLRLESESKKSVFGNSVFPSATIFEGYTQAESRNAVSPSRFFVEKNHGSQPPATADSIIFTSFRCSGKKNEFQNVVRNLNFKKSSRCYIGFRMGVPDMGVDLGYIYAKYPPKILNKRSTYGKFFYIRVNIKPDQTRPDSTQIRSDKNVDIYWSDQTGYSISLYISYLYAEMSTKD